MGLPCISATTKYGEIVSVGVLQSGDLSESVRTAEDKLADIILEKEAAWDAMTRREQLIYQSRANIKPDYSYAKLAGATDVR